MNALLEVWYLGAYDFLRPAAGAVMIDAGANVGLFSVRASRWVGERGRVIAIEPDAGSCRLLTQNLARNSVHNVTVIQKALGDEESTRADADGGSRETTTLDRIMDELNLSTVNALKMDIEGAEGRALRAASRCLAKVDKVVVETHTPDLFGEVSHLLENSGFVVSFPPNSLLFATFLRNVIRNPAAYLSAELGRAARPWDLTGGPATLLPLRWALERRQPAVMDSRSPFKLVIGTRRPMAVAPGLPTHHGVANASRTASAGLSKAERAPLLVYPVSSSPAELVSVVVRTKNSAQTLERCLHSVAAQTYSNIQVIIVDNHSADETVEIAKRYTDRVLVLGPERCHQSNAGARVSDGELVYFIDPDFVLERHVIEEAVNQVRAGADAVVITNRSDPSISFWAKVRNLERDCYVDDSEHVSARFLRRTVFLSLGGYDEDLVAAEDYDLQIRLRAGNYRIGRVQATEWHIGEPKSLREVASKHHYYGTTLRSYVAKHGPADNGKLLPFRRAFARHWVDFACHPVLSTGFLIYLTVKYGAALAGYLSSPKRRARTEPPALADQNP